jgi:hypothetical protein
MMTKKETHKQDLITLFNGWAETGDTEALTDYLVSNSNLPGRRANLELAEVFADGVADYCQRGGADSAWELCFAMTQVSADEAPVNDPREFLPFCATVGIGAIGSVSPPYYELAVVALRRLAGDPRWRMREAVRTGLQRLLAARGQDTLRALAGWVAGGDLLEMRAAAAAVAEPSLLNDAVMARSGLQLHQQIFDQLLQIEDRKTEAFRILRKALGYTLSVVVYALPNAGFEYMAHLIDTQDSDVRWIVKENLKKNRLAKNYPEEVKTMKELMT